MSATERDGDAEKERGKERWGIRREEQGRRGTPEEKSE